jgi:Txe/YoeB family toxin of toxin-antitoxin system
MAVVDESAITGESAPVIRESGGDRSAVTGGTVVLSDRIEDIRRDPFTGIGKPEPLKYHLTGAWSRRIDDEHRLVYLVTTHGIIVIAARYRY